MKRTVSILLFAAVLFTALSVQAADRTVFFEHFSQEQCATCPITAAAMTTFRNDYDYQDVAIISYWTQGSQAIPDGNNRGLEFYDEVLTPSVICDGTINIEAAPQEYDDFVAAYNSQTGVSSPCTLSIIENGGGSYTIHIVAEEAFSGSLMVVAYEEYTDGHGVTYACFARQFVTPYGGESISAGAGDVLNIDKTVSVGHSGVVAWIHNDGKSLPGNRRFTPWEVIQAADSHAGGTADPTPTPTPTGGNETPTPTTPPGTPTATPQIPCDHNGAIIDMPSDFLRSGDDFYLDVYLCNVDSVEYELPVFVILDVYGSMFFAPSWTSFDNYIATLPGNQLTRLEVLPLFTWPSGVGAANNINIYAGLTNAQMSQLWGDFDMVTFGWGN